MVCFYSSLVRVMILCSTVWENPKGFSYPAARSFAENCFPFWVSSCVYFIKSETHCTLRKSMKRVCDGKIRVEVDIQQRLRAMFSSIHAGITWGGGYSTISKAYMKVEVGKIVDIKNQSNVSITLVRQLRHVWLQQMNKKSVLLDELGLQNQKGRVPTHVAPPGVATTQRRHCSSSSAPHRFRRLVKPNSHRFQCHLCFRHELMQKVREEWSNASVPGCTRAISEKYCYDLYVEKYIRSIIAYTFRIKNCAYYQSKS